MNIDPQLISDVIDQQSISRSMYLYCRAIDRNEIDLLWRLYWPGAIDDHHPFRGPIEEFIPWCKMMLRNMVQTQHFVGNSLVELHGSWAACETYVRAYHRINREDGIPYDLVTSGRYLDRMEKRDGEWRIAHRKVVRDWFREYPDSADWGAGVFGAPMKPGLRTKDDPSYALFDGEILA